MSRFSQCTSKIFTIVTLYIFKFIPEETNLKLIVHQSSGWDWVILERNGARGLSPSVQTLPWVSWSICSQRLVSHHQIHSLMATLLPIAFHEAKLFFWRTDGTILLELRTHIFSSCFIWFFFFLLSLTAWKSECRFLNFFCKSLFCYSQRKLNLTILWFYLSHSKIIFSTFAERVAFGITLSFKQHQACNFWFKMSKKIRVTTHFTMSLQKFNLTWPMGGT